MPRSSKKLSPWAEKVWTEVRASGLGITPVEALRRFGQPSGPGSAGFLLGVAAELGYFRKVTWYEESRMGRVRKSHYLALSAPAPLKARDDRISWFDGLPKVNSVFQYGDVLSKEHK